MQHQRKELANRKRKDSSMGIDRTTHSVARALFPDQMLFPVEFVCMYLAGVLAGMAVCFPGSHVGRLLSLAQQRPAWAYPGQEQRKSECARLYGGQSIPGVPAGNILH